ncbi:MAG: hypothetical protein K6A77_05785 [Clostridiales bacterium]|nr:hypothetical protein [Clostridiales bacterium]
MEQRGETIIRLIPGGAAGWCYDSKEIQLEKALRRSGRRLWIEAAIVQPDGSVVFGDGAAFADHDDIETPVLAAVGILLNKEQTAFRIVLRLLEDTEAEEVKVIWRAYCKGKKNPLEEGPEEILEEREEPEVPAPAPSQAEDFYIEAVPGSILTGHKFMFTCHRPDGTQEAVQWALVGEDTGVINGYGMYTAPDHPGVFEVTAQAGSLKASAYIVVRDQ